MEAYSRSFDYREPVEGDPCTNYAGRYMRINTDECRENINSQMECPAMADGETRGNSGTRKLAGFLMLFYCSQSLASPNYFQTEKICEQKISYLITNGPSIRAEMRQESWRVS